MAHDPLHDVEAVEGGGIVDRQEVLGEFGANSIELLCLLTLPGLAVFRSFAAPLTEANSR